MSDEPEADRITSHVTTSCAALHTDGEGNVVPCPGYPHAEGQRPDERGLYGCPHCTDAVVNLDEHLKTCTALREEKLDEARSLLAEHERQQDEACRAEIEQVLAKYGRKLVVTQPQITIVPT
ncbi:MULTISPECIES: hypothetical protein [unclassified Streptomyces]|uniref:hypothetical protein n=1 Tax=unclassified Streptomyces TaxID=2593676 RepID=UPI0033AE1D19